MNGRYDHFWLGQQTRFGRMLFLSVIAHVILGLFLIFGWPFSRQAPVEKIYSVTLINAPKGDKDVIPTMPEPPKLPAVGKPTPEKEKPKPEPEKPKPEPEKPKPKPEPEKPKPEPEKPKPKPEPEKPKPEPEKPKPKPEPEKPKPEPKPEKKADAKTPSKEPKLDEKEDLGAVLNDLEPVGDMEPLVVAQRGPVTQTGSAINPTDGVEISLGNGVSSSWGAKLNRKIRRSWVEPTNILLDPANKVATIAFTVAADGGLVGDPEVVKHASEPELGDSAVRAVKLAAPFPPIEPPGLSEQRVICDFSLTN